MGNIQEDLVTNVESAAPQKPVVTTEPPPPVAATSFVSPPLTKALGAKSVPQQLIVKFVPNPAEGGIGNVFDVTLSGMWDGRMVIGAIRAIEKKYKQVKHLMTSEALRKAASEKLRSATVNTKGV
jgi:hypothetical protein